MATFENGSLDAPPCGGQARAISRSRAEGTIRFPEPPVLATRAGQHTACPNRDRTPIRISRPRRRCRPQRHHREFPSELRRGAGSRWIYEFATRRPTRKSWRIWSSSKGLRDGLDIVRKRLRKAVGEQLRRRLRACNPVDGGRKRSLHRCRPQRSAAWRSATVRVRCIVGSDAAGAWRLSPNADHLSGRWRLGG